MESQGNLFNAPNRPGALSIHLEREWTQGDDAVSLLITTRGTKPNAVVWANAITYQGPHWDLAASERMEAAVSRFAGSLWLKQPKEPTYEHWLKHRAF